MKIRITTLLFILLISSSLWAQEQLTFIKSYANGGSDPVYVGSVNSKTIFTVSKLNEKGESQREIWVTDGTEAGTVFLSNKVPLMQYILSPLSATNILIKNEYIYFEVAATATATGSELWRTDGTVDGTNKVMSITTEMLYSNERRVYFHASENYFFITLHDFSTGKVEINQYNSDFQPINRIPYNNIYSGPFLPHLYKDSIYFTEIFDSIILNDTGMYRNGSLEERFESNGKLYQFYRDGFADAGKLFVYDGKQMAAFPIILNPLISRVGYQAMSNKYFAYNGQIYALIVGTTIATSDLRHLNVELYVLKEDGFKFQSGVVTEPSVYAIESIWRDQSMVHIITYEKNYSGDITTVHKHHKIDIEKEYPAARTVKVIFEGDKGDIYPKNSELVFLKKDRVANERFIYNQQSEKLLPLDEEVNLYALDVFKVNADNYFIVPKINIPTDSKKDSEPFWYNSPTNNFSVLKDINTIPKGITVDPYSGEFALKNNPLLWPSVGETGVVLYKSDGTKDGTRPIKTISTKAFSFWEKRVQKDQFYAYAYQRLRTDPDYCQHCSYQEKSVSFITDGTENGTHFFEESKTINYVIHSGEDYYYVNWKIGSSDTISVVRVTPDGQRTVVRRMNPKGLLGVYTLGNDILFDFVLLPGSEKRWLVSGLTGVEIDHSGVLLYWAISDKRLFFIKQNISGKETEIYAYDDYKILKLLSVNIDEIDSRFEGEELFLFGKNDDKISVIDLNSLVVTVIPVLFKEYQLQNIRKIEGAYYSQFYKYTNGIINYKAQIFKNNTSTELTLPSEIVNPSNLAFADYKIIDNTLYFYFFENALNIYKLDNNIFTKLASLGNTYGYIAPLSGYDNALFSNVNQKMVVWRPAGTEEVADGYAKNVVPFQGKFIFDTREPNRMSKLYITDGTKAGTTLLKEFDYLANTFKLIANKIYFVAATPETGNEPWLTDGTPEGTRLIGDLWEGPASSNPTNFTDVDGVPVCLASTPDLGRQLFSLLAKLDAPLLATPNTQACEGETIVLTASKGFDSYKWIVDDGKEVITADNKLSITKSGTYKVIVGKEKASSHPSNAVSIHFIPLPAKPAIKLENTQLSVGATGQLQWYFNGTAIAGAITNTLTYSGEGDYSVKLTENTCSVLSDKLLVSITSTEESWQESVYPNPVSDKLIIKTNQQLPLYLQLVNIEGKTVLQQTLSDAENEINLKDFGKGVYILKLNQHTRKIIIE